MIETPRLKSGFQFIELDNSEYALISNQNLIKIADPKEISVLKKIEKKQYTTEELCYRLSKEMSFLELFQILTVFEKKGIIRDGDSSFSSEVTMYWEQLGYSIKHLENVLTKKSIQIHTIGEVNTSPFLSICKDTGVKISNTPDLHVVVTDDYNNNLIQDINIDYFKNNTPWLLIKPSNIEVLIGPFFSGKDTACWKCLQHRLTLNQPLTTFYSSLTSKEKIKPTHPISEQTAYNLSVLEIIKYFYHGENDTITNQIISFNTKTLKKGIHYLVKRPQCTVCGNSEVSSRKTPSISLEKKTPTSSILGGYRIISPEETFAKHKHHISNITGVIPEVTPYHKKEGTPIYNFSSGKNRALQSTSLFWFNHHLRSGNGGKGKNNIQAKTGALCEAIERYSLLYHGDEYAIKASYEELHNAILPNECMLFSEKQYDNRSSINNKINKFYEYTPIRFNKKEIMDWTPFYSLTNKSYKYVPSCFSYSQYPGKDEYNLYSYPDSNGSAAGNTREEAILQGFLELVERDAAAIWWYNRIKRPEVDLSNTENTYINEVIQYYHTIGRDIHVLDITTDIGIPTFVAISYAKSEKKRKILYAFGAHVEAKIALERAIIELNQLLPIVQNNSYLTTDPIFVNWLNTVNFETDTYLAPQSGLKKNIIKDFPDLCEKNIQNALKLCVDSAKKIGLETLYLDLTRPDISLPVVKVIVPGLRHFWRRTAPGRLYTVPVKLGWLSKKNTEESLNPKSIFI